MSFLKKAFSKRSLGHSKESSSSTTPGYGSEAAASSEFGYFGEFQSRAATLNDRGDLPKPAPPFYSVNGRRSANGSSSSRMEEEAPLSLESEYTLNTPSSRTARRRQSPSAANPWESYSAVAETHSESRYLPPTPEDSQLDKPIPPPPKPPKSSFSPFLVNLAGVTIESPSTGNALVQSPQEDEDSYVSPYRKPLSAAEIASNPYLTPITPLNRSTHPTDDHSATRRRKRQDNSSFLQAIAEAHLDQPATKLPLTPVSPDPQAFDATQDDVPLTKRLEEAAKQARIKAATSVVPTIDQHISQPSTPSPEFETASESLPTPPEDDYESPPPPPPPKSQRSIPNELQKLQALVDQNLHDLGQDKTDHEDLKQAEEQLEQDQIFIDKLEAELLSSEPNSHQSLPPPPPSRPPPPAPPILADNDNDQQTSSPPASPSESVTDSDPDVVKLKEEAAILRNQLAASKSRIETLAKEKTQSEERHREEAIEFLQRLKDKQDIGDRRLKEVKRLTTERDLADVRVDSILLENKQIKEDRDDILQQLKFQVEENQRLEDDIRSLRKEVAGFMAYKSQMREKEATYNKLNNEKAGWQAQIDVMQHKLSDAEKRVRCLDSISRQRYESRQEGGYGSGSTVGRSALLHHSPHVKGPSVDVSAAVAAFNQEVQHAAWMLSDALKRPTAKGTMTIFTEHQRTRARARAKLIWGGKMTVLLEKHAKETKNNDLLMLTCMEIFITHWCVQIIEGWYPYLASFSDILIQLVEQKGSADSLTMHKLCGKQTQVIRTGTAEPEYALWTKEISDDLLPLLRIAGVQIPSEQSSFFTSKLLPILKLAYNLRLALAERDICGGLELAAPSPDSPFNPGFMDSGDAGKKSRKNQREGSSSYGTDWTVQEAIAGTKAIGLKRTLDGKPGQYEMVMLPQIMLVRELESTL